jgi:hypothetical protein
MLAAPLAGCCVTLFTTLTRCQEVPASSLLSPAQLLSSPPSLAATVVLMPHCAALLTLTSRSQ